MRSNIVKSGEDAALIINAPAKKIYLAVLAAAGAAVLGLMPLGGLCPVLIVLSGLALGILIISLFAYDDFNFLFVFYSIGFLLRIFLSLLFYAASFVFYNEARPGYFFANDGWLCSMQGWQICKFVQRGIQITSETFLNNPNIYTVGNKVLSGNITNYDFFASRVYSITGYSPLSLFFISSIAGSIAALFIYFIAKRLFSKNVARISALFVFFWPSFILWSTQNLKESMIMMLAGMLLASIVYMRRYFNLVFLISSFLSAGLLYAVSMPFFVIVVCTVLLSLAFLYMDYFFKNRFVTLAAVFFLLAALGFYFKGSVVSLLSTKDTYGISTFKSIFDFIGFHHAVRAEGSLQFLAGFDISSPGRLLLYTPLGLLFVLFSPFPWQLGSVAQIMAFPETILYYFMLPVSVKGLIFAYKKRFNSSAMLFFVIVAIVAFLAVLEANSGTMFRHRSIAFYFLFVFTAVGLTLEKVKFGTVYKC